MWSNPRVVPPPTGLIPGWYRGYFYSPPSGGVKVIPSITNLRLNQYASNKLPCIYTPQPSPPSEALAKEGALASASAFSQRPALSLSKGSRDQRRRVLQPHFFSINSTMPLPASRCILSQGLKVFSSWKFST